MIKVNEWNIIGELTDKSVLGTEGMSDKEPRRTARGIVVNEEGLYAVLYVQKYGLYSLPGGGIEEGESIKDALIREIYEETGGSCDEIFHLGVVSENRYHADYTALSYYFVVNTFTTNNEIHLTEKEVEDGIQLKWCTLEEAIHLIKDCKHNTNQRKFLQARDVVALQEYCRYLQDNSIGKH